MTTSTIGSTFDPTSTQATSASVTPDRLNSLTGSDFLKIMFTELSNQDPLKPNDSNTLLQQFSSLRNIEADLALQDKLSTVVSQGQLSTAGALLGKYVGGYDDNFNPVQGLVRSISQTADGPILNLDNGSRIAFKNLAEIVDPNDLVTPPATTPPATTPPTTTPPADPPVTPSIVPPSTTPLTTNPTQSSTGAN